MTAIDPLANPKGVVRVCELCQKPAYIQCSDCRVTFYCGREHQQVDYVGIHERICQLLMTLRTSMPFASSEEQREHNKQQLIIRQLHLLNVTRTAGQKLLFENQFTEAIPAAMQSLRVAIELYGLASVELVPSYLILGRASIGLGNLGEAEQYLLQAQWTVLKTPQCSNTIRHKLSRYLGLLYATKRQFSHALRQLAYDIYYASEEFGVHDIQTSGGYFHMAEVFQQQGNVTVAQSLYRQVAEIWQRHLSTLVNRQLNEANMNNSMLDVVTSHSQTLDESEQAEALLMLTSILQFEQRQSDTDDLVADAADDDDGDGDGDGDDGDDGDDGGAGPGGGAGQAIAGVLHSLAMLHYLLHDNDKAKDYSRKAVSASASMTENEEFSRELVEFLKICENVNTSVD